MLPTLKKVAMSKPHSFFGCLFNMIVPLLIGIYILRYGTMNICILLFRAL